MKGLGTLQHSELENARLVHDLFFVWQRDLIVQ